MSHTSKLAEGIRYILKLNRCDEPIEYSDEGYLDKVLADAKPVLAATKGINFARLMKPVKGAATPKDSVRFAAGTVKFYQNVTKNDDLETSVQDLINDLMHYCAAHNLYWNQLEERASVNYSEERGD